MTALEAKRLVTVVLVSWNTASETVACIHSVLEHDPQELVEIIVVDNDSADDTVARVNAFGERVRVIANATNEGFARACNQGMAASSTPFILLLNSDTHVTDDVIVRSARWLENHPAVGMVGCQVKTEDGRRIHTAWRRLGVRQSLLENLWLYRLIPSERRPHVLLGGYWVGDEDVEPDWLVGVYLCLRREVFELSGGFDPRFFMYGEDSEWGMRLRRLGVRLVCSPTLGTVIHQGGRSSEGVWSERERLRRGHLGGLRAYEMVNGRARMYLYWAAQLLGYSVRWAVYAAAARIRPNDYYKSQSRLYGWLRDFYLRPRHEY
jgi:N-acetylglucosaminyl-diphospho-decaprenol L-rhamnosyltransferase